MVVGKGKWSWLNNFVCSVVVQHNSSGVCSSQCNTTTTCSVANVVTEIHVRWCFSAALNTLSPTNYISESLKKS